MKKCTDCGYLAVRNVDSRELEEAEEVFREKGTGPMAKVYEGNPHLRHEKQPLCFARVHSFSDDFKKAIKENIPEDGRVKQIIQKERQCDKSTDWQQGFTPKEHREMLDREWMIRQEEKRDQDARDWQSQESQRNRKWRLAEFLIAVLALGLIVLAAFIERGGQPTINIITPEPPEVIIEE